MRGQTGRGWRSVTVVLIAMLMVALPANKLFAQGAVVTGRVLADSTEKPLRNAEVLLKDLKRSTRSDSTGLFLINGVPTGKHQLEVRMVGYKSYSANITIVGQQSLDADFLLSPTTTTLEKVNVTAANGTKVNMRLAEFEERRATPGSGHFFTADVFEKNHGSNLTDIFMGRIPGLRRPTVNGSNVRPLTGRPTGQKYNCYVAIILNGLTVYNSSYGTNFFDIDRSIITGDVIGAEYYSVASTPLKYQATGSECGTLVIWTK